MNFLIDNGEEGKEPPSSDFVDEQMLRGKFIKSLVPHAQKLNKKFEIYTSIIISQAILESDYGRSDLARKYHNLFGVKEFGNSPAVELKTKEYRNGHWVEVSDKFKIYSSFEASMDGLIDLFVNGVDWNRNLYQDVLHAKNYQSASLSLQNAGYATDPNYASKLIAIIEENNLDKYDK